MKIVLITGASSGLGLALAKKLKNDTNYGLILTSRKESLNRFKEENIYESNRIWIRPLNVVDHLQISKLIEEINDKLGGVDILINNAGIAERSSVEESDDVYRQQQLDVNYLAPFEIISGVLSKMRQKKFGRIINISSAGGFMAMPTMSSYSASKFALEGATESLWYEVRPWKIAITLVVPGFINSLGHLNTIHTQKCHLSCLNPNSAYYKHYTNMKQLIAKCMNLSFSTNDSIASKIVKVMKSARPPLRVFVTIDAWLFYWLRKISPPGFYHFLMYSILPNIALWGMNEFEPQSDMMSVDTDLDKLYF
jgi:short-subunit dehydrogenase